MSDLMNFKRPFKGNQDEDADAHVLRFKDMLATVKLPLDEARAHATKILMFKFTLAEYARKWYDSEYENFVTIEEMENEFKRKFSKYGQTQLDFETAWQTLRYDPLCESIDKFSDRIKDLAKLLKYDGQAALNAFKRTMPPNLFPALVNCPNLLEAVKVAKDMMGVCKLHGWPLGLQPPGNPTSSPWTATSVPALGTAPTLGAMQQVNDLAVLNALNPERGDSTAINTLSQHIKALQKSFDTLGKGNAGKEDGKIPEKGTEMHEVKEMIARLEGNFNFRQQQTPTPYKPEVKNNYRPNNNYNNNNYNNRRNFQNRDSFQDREDKEKGRCFQCHQPGHMKRNCPTLRREKDQGRTQDKLNYLTDRLVKRLQGSTQTARSKGTPRSFNYMDGLNALMENADGYGEDDGEVVNLVEEISALQMQNADLCQSDYMVCMSHQHSNFRPDTDSSGSEMDALKSQARTDGVPSPTTTEESSTDDEVDSHEHTSDEDIIDLSQIDFDGMAATWEYPEIDPVVQRLMDLPPLSEITFPPKTDGFLELVDDNLLPGLLDDPEEILEKPSMKLKMVNGYLIPDTLPSRNDKVNDPGSKSPEPSTSTQGLGAPSHTSQEKQNGSFRETLVVLKNLILFITTLVLSLLTTVESGGLLENLKEERPNSSTVKSKSESSYRIKKNDVEGLAEAEQHFSREDRMDIKRPYPFSNFLTAEEEKYDADDESERDSDLEEEKGEKESRQSRSKRSKKEDQLMPIRTRPTAGIHDVDEWSIFASLLCYVSTNKSDTLPIDINNAKVNKTIVQNLKDEKVHTFKNSSQLQMEPYEGVRGVIELKQNQDKVSNKKAITISYLGPRDLKEDITEQVRVSLTGECRTKGMLPNGDICDVLIDTGASTSMINKDFIKSNKWLNELPLLQTESPTTIKVADGKEYRVSTMLQFLIELNGHTLQVLALVVPMTAAIQVVIGYRSLIELEASVDSPNSELVFHTRCAICKADRSLVVSAGETALLGLEVETPFPLNGQAVYRVLIDGKVMSKLLHFFNNKALIRFKNNDERAFEVREGDAIGVVDLRSVGYYHVNLHTLTQLVGETYEFESLGTLVDFLYCKHNPEKAKVKKQQIIEPDDPLPTEGLESNANKEKEVNPFVNMGSNKNLVKPTSSKDPYPWLDLDDPRRGKTDAELIREHIHLEEAVLSPDEKEEFYKVIEQYRDAFSLRDEIGLCPSLKVHLYLKDKAPFFIRPYPIKQGEKQFIDNEIKRLVHLGVLRQGLSSYSSPIMLIPRKNSTLPRMVTDFRHLNTRLVRLNVAFPLVRDIIQKLGDSKIEVVSVIDLRDAYHTLRLDEPSKQYCGIIPYYGADSFLYQRLGMGLAVSPAIWQTFINFILDNVEDRDHHVAIMDDCMTHSVREDHTKHLKDLFKALIKQGLKISPRKCQFFRNQIIYMGSILKIETNGLTVTPLRTRIEAIDKLATPTTPKECRMFCGVVNYLSMFLPYIRQMMKPIYELTKKTVPFKWEEKQETAFKNVKHALKNYPVLWIPNSTDRFQLYSDTSQIATGGALYQVQSGKPRLIAYASRKLVPAVKRYSITELEMFGLALNIRSFKHYLSRVEFDVVVDHSAIAYIMKQKHEPTTDRLKKLVRDLQNYAFKTYYMKGKDMVLCDFLSRYPIEGEANVEATPCYVVTRSELKKQGLQLPRAEDVPLPTRQGVVTVPVPTRISEGSELSPSGDQETRTNIPNITTTVQPNVEQTIGPDTRTLQIHPPNDPLLSGFPPEDITNLQPRPLLVPPQPIGIAEDLGLIPPFSNEGPLPKGDFIELHKTPVVPEPHVVPPDRRLYLKESLRIDQSREPAMCKHLTKLEDLPHQKNVNKLLKAIQKRHILDTQLPITLKELQNAYLNSPDFKGIYKYILTGFTEGTKEKAKIIRSYAEDFTIISGILFKIDEDQFGEIQTRLAVPEQFRDLLLHVFHDSLLGAHRGFSKTYFTIKKKFYVPRLFQLIRLYKIACHVCQLARKPQEQNRAFVPRIPTQYVPMNYMSCDVKYMPKTREGYQYMIIFTCEITGYIVAAALKERTSQHLAEALLKYVVWQFGPPQVLIFDEDRAMSSTLLEYLYQKLQITPKVISPYNHGSLKTERYIRTISSMMMKYLQGTGDAWPTYLSPIT